VSDFTNTLDPDLGRGRIGSTSRGIALGLLSLKCWIDVSGQLPIMASSPGMKELLVLGSLDGPQTVKGKVVPVLN
jgi:hypothetical protein